MRALLLSALLLATPAAAQSTVPTVPAPAGPAAATPTLLITAPVGTTVEQRLTISTRMTLKEIKVEALPGQRLSAQEVEQTRQTFSKALSGRNTQETGKLFTRVTSRSADGRVGLLQTFLQNIPGQKEPISFRITQSLTPDGQSEGLKFTSDDALLNEIFSRMNLEDLQRMAAQNGSSVASTGQALVPGQVEEETMEMPTQDLLASMFGPVLGEEALLRASPMKIVSRTVYTGQNAAGFHQFQTQSVFSDWRFELGEPLPMSAALLNATTNGTHSVRPDGLPGASQDTTRMTLQLSIVSDKARVNVAFEQERTIRVENR
ncbi:hypothetical protein [Deinococcus arcticus]|uniref:Uncharacterized protein n=1 Tax=Deinococcus arcticus TaxID=2136176 RepID=A0A2T3W591_9DEIO|nr:hypothetical protein [Deinococcus arcticus]PTA67066.1 hypothetical protein C8263_14195 [Deinococcus arcticus]